MFRRKRFVEGGRWKVVGFVDGRYAGFADGRYVGFVEVDGHDLYTRKNQRHHHRRSRRCEAGFSAGFNREKPVPDERRPLHQRPVSLHDRSIDIAASELSDGEVRIKGRPSASS